MSNGLMSRLAKSGFKRVMSRGLIAGVSCLVVSPVLANDVFHRHRYSDREVVRYRFEDTDTVFMTVSKDGSIEAGDAVKVQEIQIPVLIAVSSADGVSSRRLTISDRASYRESDPKGLSSVPFRPVSEIDRAIPPSFAYTYKDDTDALNHLQGTFESIRKTEIGNFLFYKMEDVHQMQESAERIPEGMAPGQVHRTPRHERKGLGGEFISAPGQMIYQSTETFNGIKAGYFKVISLGHEFSLPTLKTYTNFSFTMHVALEGPAQGLLLFGEGQETATVLKGSSDDGFKPLVILQRQFSIRRQ